MSDVDDYWFSTWSSTQTGSVYITLTNAADNIKDYKTADTTTIENKMESIDWDKAAVEYLTHYQNKLLDTLIMMGLKEDGKFNEKFVEWLTNEFKRINKVTEDFLLEDDIEINTDDNVESVDITTKEKEKETETPATPTHTP